MVPGWAMGVQPRPAPYQPIPVPYITGLDPFKAMAMSVAAAKHLRCRQGRGGASTTTLPLSFFGFVEMLDQEAKAEPFHNVVNNSGC